MNGHTITKFYCRSKIKDDFHLKKNKTFIQNLVRKVFWKSSFLKQMKKNLQANIAGIILYKVCGLFCWSVISTNYVCIPNTEDSLNFGCYKIALIIFSQNVLRGNLTCKFNIETCEFFLS